MKNFLLILCAFLLCFSCTDVTKSKEQKIGKQAVGTVLNDSVIKMEVVPFKTGPKIPKENYISSARPFSLDPLYGKEVVSSITPKDGMPPARFNTFNTDSKGNIWLSNFGSQILKYNGQTFKDYGILDSGWYNFQMEITFNDQLWLNRFNPSSQGFEWRTLLFDGLNFNEISELNFIESENDGSLTQFISKGYKNSTWYLNTIDNTLLKYQGEELLASYNIEGLALELLTNVSDFGDDGTFFFDGRSDKLIKLYHGTFEEVSFKNLIPEDKINDVLVINSTSFYVSTPKGTFLIEDGKSTQINDESLFRGVLDEHNTLWSYSENGIVKTNALTSIDFYDNPELKKLERLDLHKDEKGNIWVTGQSFMGRFENSIKTYDNLIEDNSKNQNRSLRSLIQAVNGDFFYGSFFNGLFHFDGNTLTNFNFLKQPTQDYGTINNIGNLVEDNHGNIWFTHGNRDEVFLTKYDGTHFQSYNMGQERFVFIELIDSKGKVWLTSSEQNNNYNLLTFDGKSLVKITSSNNLGGFYFSSVFEDHLGNIWIGSEGGLYNYNNETITNYSVKDGMPNNVVNSINEDDNNNLWIGTDGGLSILSNNVFTNYGKADGLKESSIGTILKDDHNNKFWLRSGSSDRLSVVSLDSLNNRLVVENFSSAEGFPIPSGRGLVVDQQGVGWITTTDGGLARFDYPALKENSRAFPVSVTNIRINGESIVWSHLNDRYANDTLVSSTEMNSRFGLQKTEEELDRLKKTFTSVRYDSLVPYDFIPLGLKLPYSANSLSFEFSAVDPFLAKSTQFQYFLEGFDKAWSPLGQTNIANYGNLYEGDYTLKIKALNPYGIWSETDYAFTVLPPWYRTWWAYGIYGVLLLLLFKQVHTYQKQRTIKKEREKAKERELEQAKEIEKAYNDLKATQQQLIQSEKMASLGELTAGIAHEIQNPLNFVNNFSEVSNELIDEMNDELDKGAIEEAKAIATDIKQNLEKITHHGKRADGIVKGMLAHSRSGSGEKVPTDINALADEYLRLSYHGLRARDKSFNADFSTNLDPTLPKVKVVPQDIGRVLLNLINNAFQAVNGIENPKVVVSTKHAENGIEITVSDNGPGIPEAIKDKIFQPFFTTKPTGQGTGLGLSLSYDIVKAHGGELILNSNKEKGTQFTIILPLV
ncbi:GHKL domain-containing protein [Paucihalobacter ruber]|uniref:histidine kinase n=1 Tax=Paucihalobacter ruber TaxID=2567861 RepID=A0A506PGW9_9FLAO|nr:ATP-binding protein [Paucihalobacter ruber]TPV32758.1 GHKL domain-containing protein [Paucihalobacter ruber]